MATIVPCSMFSLMRIASKIDAAVRSRCFWTMTPAAFVSVCMFPNGQGKFLGDDICFKKKHPSLWGNDIEIINPMEANECRFALVNPLAVEREWHEFREPLVPKHRPDDRNFSIEILPFFAEFML
jgi:hypothetical protein